MFYLEAPRNIRETKVLIALVERELKTIDEVYTDKRKKVKRINEVLGCLDKIYNEIERKLNANSHKNREELTNVLKMLKDWFVKTKILKVRK